MDMQFWWMLFKVVVFLPFILMLIYITMKYGGNKLQDIQNGKFIKVLERTAISKENNLLVVKIGQNGYVMSSTNGKIEILLELSQAEIAAAEESRTIPQYRDLKDFYEKVGLKKINDTISKKSFYKKLKIIKEDKNE